MLRWPLPVNSPKRRWFRSPNRRNRFSMFRIVLFLVLIALAAWGAAWVADQPGEVALSFGAAKYIVTLPVFALFLGIVIVLAMMVLGFFILVLRTPGRISRGRLEPRILRGRHALTHGLLAIRHGDAAAARPPAPAAAARQPPAAAPGRAPATRRPPAAMPTMRAGSPATIRWRCCCTRNRRSS